MRISQRWLAAVFLVAVAYRAACFVSVGEHTLFRSPVVDAKYYEEWATRLVAGDRLGHSADDVFKPPTYAYFLASVYTVTGRHVATVQVLQLLFGALSCVLMAILGARLAGWRTGVVAGFLAACYAPFPFFEMQLLAPALSILLNLTALLLVVRREGRARAGHWAAAGAVFGVSAGVRPDVAVPAGLVLAWLLWRDVDGGWRLRARFGGCAALAFALAVMPITLRNMVLTGRLIPVSSNGGINFYIGNRAGADGVSAVPVGLRWERLVSRMPQPVLDDPVAAARWWERAAWREMASEPAAAAGRVARKTLAFLSAREFRNNICFHWLQARSVPLWLSPVQYASVLPLAAAGMLLLRRREPRAFALCLLWTGGYGVACVLFFVTARFRLPAVPLLIIPAAFALTCLAAAMRAGDRRVLAGSAAAMALAGVICWPAWFGMPEARWADDWVNVGNSRAAAGDAAAAGAAYRQALELAPDHPDANYLLGGLLAGNDPQGAVRHFRAALAALPESPDALLALAQAQGATGQINDARHALEEILAVADRCNLWPRRSVWATAHILLAQLDPPQAVPHWSRAWEIDPRTAAEVAFLRHRDLDRVLQTFATEAASKPWDWYSQANQGVALLATGQPAAAVGPLQRAVRLAPEREALSLHLGKALLGCGRKDEGRAVLTRLRAALPDCPLRREAEALSGKVR